MRVVSLFASCLIVLALLAASGAQAAEPGRELRLQAPANARQGTAVRVVASIDAFAPGEEPEFLFSWLKKHVRARAVHDGTRWRAETLLPVGVNEGKKLVVHASTPTGATRASASISVAAVAWPEQRISVNKNYVTPPKDVLHRIEAERAKSAQAVGRVTPERLWEDGFVRPVPGVVTSAFGGKRMFNGKMRSYHRGVDLRGAQGTPIRALAGGEVVLAENMYYSGNVVYLDHGQGVISIYCHMSSMNVRPGDRVRAGHILGEVGATGRVTGPHLHLGLLILGEAVDPLSLLARGK